MFAGSLRAVSPEAALVLYLDAPLPDTHQQIVERYAITSIEFTVQLLEPAFLRKYHPSNYRWPLLYRYLKEHAGIYDKVVMADVRDTMFQSDPFASSLAPLTDNDARMPCGNERIALVSSRQK